MARTNNLNDFLTDVAGAIKEKTGDSTAIPASQFDTKIRSIETGGNYQAKTVEYTTNGTRQIVPDTNYDALSEVNVTVNVPTPVPVLQNKTATQNGSYSADPGYDGLGTVLVNVQGQVNNQDKTITQNGQYTADSGYTGLGTVTVNVPSGSGDVKLFETEQAMQADPSSSEGDLAVIYRSEIQNWDGESDVSSFYFPDTVIFTTAISEEFWVYGYGSSGGECRIDGMVSASSADFRVENWDIGLRCEITYTSSDGLTYTRTDSEGNPIDLGDTQTFRMYEWDEKAGEFIQAGGKTFEGLYEYVPVAEEDGYIKLTGSLNGYVMKTPELTVPICMPNAGTIDVTMIVKTLELRQEKFYDLDVYVPKDYYILYNDIYQSSGNSTIWAHTVLKGNDTCTICGNNYQNTNSRPNEVGVYIEKYVNKVMTESAQYTNQQLLNMRQVADTNTSSNWRWYTFNFPIISPSDLAVSNTCSFEKYNTDFEVYSNQCVAIYDGNLSDLPAANFNVTTMDEYTKTINYHKYLPAQNQFNLTNANQLLPDISAYGKIEAITGDGSIYNNLDMVQLFNSINGTTVTDKQILTQSNTGKGQFTIYGDDVPVEQNVFVEKSNVDNGYLYNRGETFLYSTEDNAEKPMLCKVLDNRIFHFLDSTNGVMEYQRVDRNNKNIGEKVITTLSNTHIFDVISDGTYWYIVADTTIYKYNPVNKSYTTVYTGINNGNGIAVSTNNSWFRETALFYDNNYLYVKNCYLTGTQRYRYNGYTEVFTINLSNNSRTNLWSAMGGSSYMFYTYNDFYKCNNLNFVKYNNYVYIAVMNGTNISLLKCTPTSGTILNTGATGGSDTMCYYQTLVCDNNYLYYLYSNPGLSEDVSGCYRYNGSTFTRLDNVKASMYGILYPIYVDNVLKFCGTYLYNIDGTTYHSTNELRSISPQRDVFQEGNVVILTGLHRPKGYYDANAWFAHDEVTAKVNVLPYISNDMIDFGYATYKQTSSSTTNTCVRCKSYLYAPIIGNAVSDIYYNLNDGFVEPGDIE